jgi:[ribosomal protein S18]-alanine N-acetyltransferase
MLIRRATAADTPAIMSLEQGVATAAHWSAEQYRKAFSGDAPSRFMLVLEEDDRVQAFIAGKALGEEWEIENIAVAGPARRRGLGARLLGEFLDLARSQGAQAVFLEVRESNLAAQKLYEKWAFVETGRRKLYYRDPEEDAIIFRLGLP